MTCFRIIVSLLVATTLCVGTTARAGSIELDSDGISERFKLTRTDGRGHLEPFESGALAIGLDSSVAIRPNPTAWDPVRDLAADLDPGNPRDDAVWAHVGNDDLLAWSKPTVPLTVLPLSPAFWLLGSGFVGLLLLARRPGAHS